MVDLALTRASACRLLGTFHSQPPHFTMSASVAQPSQASRQQPGTQKRLFRSISRFLSGGSGKQKLQKPAAERTVSSSSVGGTAAASAGAGAALGDLRSSTRSTSTGDTASTSMQEDEDDDSLSRLSGISGADTDASLRPISPSSVGPASSVISRTDSTSNASFAPTHGTFKSYASTKPTTLSLDSGGGGANRIAVVPGTGAQHALHPHSHLLPTSSSGGSLGASQSHTPSSLSNQPITFSALPASLPTTPLEAPDALSSSSSAGATDKAETTQVPRHTLAHPRNNPHPASPPPDNASMITLASSSFAPSFSHPRTPGGVLPSAASGTGSFGGGGLTGLRAWRKGDPYGDGGADEDASVRVLAGSRRASDESLGGKSTWSAAVGRSVVGVGGGGLGGLSRSERAPSVRTVGTTGTGGDLLSQAESEQREEEGEREEGDKARRHSLQGGETEAQRVVRHEGVRDDLAASTSARPSAPGDTPTNLTPTTELESPPLGSPTSVAMTNANTLTVPPPIPYTTTTTTSTADGEDGTMTPTTKREAVMRPMSIGSGAETDAASFADAQSQLSQDSRV